MRIEDMNEVYNVISGISAIRDHKKNICEKVEVLVQSSDNLNGTHISKRRRLDVTDEVCKVLFVDLDNLEKELLEKYKSF